MKQSKGITLVALVLTIVILLILAAISIQALTNQGLFAQAQNAKNLTEEKTAEESKILKNYLKEIDLQLGRLSGKAQPGDYVTYTPDSASTDEILEEISEYSGNTDSTKNTIETLKQETNLKWRVLDVVDGKVRLISATPTTSTLTLYGAKGYNNAVYLLDKTCRTLYSKTGYSEKVQNLKIEDIQDYLTYDYTQCTNSYVNTGKYYGTLEITGFRAYPKLFAMEKTGWVDGIQGTALNLSEQTTPINETSTGAKASIKITQTYWGKSMAESDFTNPIYYDLFIAKKNEDNQYNKYSKYWLSSRCINAYNGSCIYFVRSVGKGIVGAISQFNSAYAISYGGEALSLRTVVTLKHNVLVKSGDGTSATPYEIDL